ncbi:hypothetical protein HELRODRAFT_66811 [Helobdella robusta]|uniref:Dymeclin n=1 Tax=Helobdella robusta TaxID=6412 RepID=T1FYR2_HELRO|nr:hypothetical protein HELRODRAFT_66811 [Helobdella robusta]ESN98857.1 hypothetical protein HELRODRAFT_66811 [Helobdella robusta]
MGANNSTLSKDLSNNEYLLKLSGPDYISPNEPFWNQLLSFAFSVPKTSADQRHLEDITSNLCKNFAINNCRTGNFGSLIRVFLMRANELSTSALCKDDLFTWQTCNALFIIRIVCKYFIENLTEEVVVQQFETINYTEGTNQLEARDALMEEFLNRLVYILIDVPQTDVTYSIHIECINIILSLLSIQLFQMSPASESMLHRCFMQGKCSRNSCKLVKNLLETFTSQCRTNNNTPHGALYGVACRFISSLWSVVTLGLANQKTEHVVNESRAMLANQSLLLLLVLCNQFCSNGSFINPYQTAFLSLHDDIPNAIETPATRDHISVKFLDLYTTICSTIKTDTCTLLVYMLLHRVEPFKTYCLSRTNIEQLVLPILEMLYNSHEGNSQHLYMALIIILILSEDANFSLAVHDIPISKQIPWFNERQLGEISLGGLMVLVLVRTIQYNMTRMRDQYLHTNCLGALANMSSHFMNLHPYVAQRLVSLFALLLKKHKKAADRLKEIAEIARTNENKIFIPLLQELAVIEEVIRMTLEILNSCLCHSLNYNPNLVYTMLYQKEIFVQLSSHPSFQDIVFNIEMILNYFASCLEKQGGSLSVTEVHALIKQAGLQFKKDRLKKFPELKFRYVEEERPEEFFVPYVWSLVYKFSHIYFNPSRIRLFPA